MDLVYTILTIYNAMILVVILIIMDMVYTFCYYQMMIWLL